MSRRLIVTADDFGLCAGVNDGIVAAHERGIVTATSVMMRRVATADLVRLARDHPALAIGVHVDLGEWVYAAGEWSHRDQVVDPTDRAAVEREVSRQVDAFVDVLGRAPTHLDSHQHVHREEPSATVVAACADRLGVPVRDREVRYEGGFYGQAGRGEPYRQGITVANLVRVLQQLPEGTTELGCHPGIDVPASLTSYAAERAIELEALCAAEVREAIAALGIELVGPPTGR